MPDKPLWYDRLAEAEAQLATLPSPWVDRATLESILGIGRRRAQQLLQPLVRHTIGRNGLALKDEVIRYLRHLARGDKAVYEQQRRRRVAGLIQTWHREALKQPQVLVEASDTILAQHLEDLPEGVRLSPGRILIESFMTPDEAKQKLLALIMAMGNDPEEFDRRITMAQTAPGQ
ncbi:MAG: hypothetical protein JO061_02330 [Acidobacteriaceae bacterium]|nr:hypothetical protein [Acidobacteriaceae bacterium]